MDYNLRERNQPQDFKPGYYNSSNKKIGDKVELLCSLLHTVCGNSVHFACSQNTANHFVNIPKEWVDKNLDSPLSSYDKFFTHFANGDFNYESPRSVGTTK